LCAFALANLVQIIFEGLYNGLHGMSDKL